MTDVAFWSGRSTCTMQLFVQRDRDDHEDMPAEDLAHAAIPSKSYLLIYLNV